jgi:hypothetical protein
MIFKQYYLQSLSHASYLLENEERHVAAIVDPQRDVDHYLLALDHHHLAIFTRISWLGTLNYTGLQGRESILVHAQPVIFLFIPCRIIMK